MEIKMTITVPELKVNVTCPKCDGSLAVPFRELKPGGTKTCPNCGVNITFDGDDLSKIQNLLDINE